MTTPTSKTDELVKRARKWTNSVAATGVHMEEPKEVLLGLADALEASKRYNRDTIEHFSRSLREARRERDELAIVVTQFGQRLAARKEKP